LHINCEKDTEDFCRTWDHFVEEPAKRAGLLSPHLVVLKSPHRFVVSPIVDYVLEFERNNPDRQVAVLIQSWWNGTGITTSCIISALNG
jgi:hypothetical protein